jgi:hypothetical protein
MQQTTTIQPQPATPGKPHQWSGPALDRGDDSLSFHVNTVTSTTSFIHHHNIHFAQSRKTKIWVEKAH